RNVACGVVCARADQGEIAATSKTQRTVWMRRFTGGSGELVRDMTFVRGTVAAYSKSVPSPPTCLPKKKRSLARQLQRKKHMAEAMFQAAYQGRSVLSLAA